MMNLIEDDRESARHLTRLFIRVHPNEHKIYTTVCSYDAGSDHRRCSQGNLHSFTSSLPQSGEPGTYHSCQRLSGALSGPLTIPPGKICLQLVNHKVISLLKGSLHHRAENRPHNQISHMQTSIRTFFRNLASTLVEMCPGRF